MPYARQYDVAEVKGMLMIAEGSANVKAFRAFAANQAKKGKKASFAKAPAAHASTLHVAQTKDDLEKRADTGPAVTSTFKDLDTLVLAAVEGLNHANGQAALALLDAGNMDAFFNAPLAGNKYYGSRSTRTGAKGTQSVTSEPFMIATGVSMKVVAYVANKLWIQTCFPSALNARPAPSLADLP